MKNQICTILGGGGFIGRYLVRNLTKKNYRCIISTRKVFQKGYLKTQATPGAIELIDWNSNNFSELKEAILLLDEPARNLHPTQQMGISDLLKNLAGSNQVLYATHSPFMIFDYTPGNLLVVELDKRKHLSRIFYDYWNADDKTLTPILYGLCRG